MKKIVALLVLGCASMSWAEAVSSVVYNPSRLGQYTRLKVSSNAVLRGGLQTPLLNIASNSSGNGVKMKNNLLFASGLSKYNIGLVQSKAGTISNSIQMENVVFKGADLSENLGLVYMATSDITPTNVLNQFEVRGGTVKFLDDSYIESLEVSGITSGVPELRINASQIEIPRLKINNTSSTDYYFYDNSNPQKGRGLVLGGRDIPYSSQASNRQLCWVKYPVEKGEEKYEAFLLALYKQNLACPTYN